MEIHLTNSKSTTAFYFLELGHKKNSKMQQKTESMTINSKFRSTNAYQALNILHNRQCDGCDIQNALETFL